MKTYKVGSTCIIGAVTFTKHGDEYQGKWLTNMPVGPLSDSDISTFGLPVTEPAVVPNVVDRSVYCNPTQNLPYKVEGLPKEWIGEKVLVVRQSAVAMDGCYRSGEDGVLRPGDMSMNILKNTSYRLIIVEQPE